MLYPLKFQPILKEKIWGGTKLKTLYNKILASDQTGESWELSGMDGSESVVINGSLKGNTITELIEMYKGSLVGDKVYRQFGLTFPLLFKFIDANYDLSIQVHPNDEIASQKHKSYGKTELWYVVDADPGTEMILGFSKNFSREDYQKAIVRGEVEKVHQKIPVKKGDVLYIPAGTVHGIGGGTLLVEIQQTSDVTYRIYDYKRLDEHGRERDLHIDQALDAINFGALHDPKIFYDDIKNTVNLLVSNKYFTTNFLHLDSPIRRSYTHLDSFVVFICVDGSVHIESALGTVTLEKGETLLIPAVADEISLIPDSESILLETYILL